MWNADTIPIEALDCPECCTTGPEKVGVDPGGTFIWVACGACLLEWAVRG